MTKMTGRKTDIEDLKHRFETLPDERSRSYEEKLGKIAQLDYDDLEEVLMGIIKDEGSPYRFPAFFALSIRYRRNKDYEKLSLLIKDYRETFKRSLSFNHIRIGFYTNSDYYSYIPEDYNSILSLAYNDTKFFADNSGYLHTFCNAFVTICERVDDEDKKELIEAWYEDALEMIKKAIEMEEYPKYYSTKGRIIALKGLYDDAISNINKAIGMESSDRPDYELTISTYQNYITQIKLEKTRQELLKRIEEIDRFIKIPEPVKVLSSVPKACKSKQNYCFVSYAHADSEDVFPIIEELNKRNVKVWFDQGINTGEEWKEVVEDRIKRCSVFLWMVSSISIQKDAVKKEVDQAIREGKEIILIRFDDSELSRGFDLEFGSAQYIKADAPDFYDRLIKEIRYRMGEQ